MKRFISAFALCVSLLVLLLLFLFSPAIFVEAKENVLLKLLNLPAPPPPNPLSKGGTRDRDEKFYDKNNPPKDNAPTGELLDYWLSLANGYRELGYNPKPSERNAERIMAEIEKNPKSLPQYLNILPDGERSADFVKNIFDREGTNGVFDRGERGVIKRWLTYHSRYYSSDLARAAGEAGDVNEYVSNQNELLALARFDFDKARPIIDRLSNDRSQRVSQVLAKWALYRHALDSDSIGDIETYRDELKAIVEDKSATNGMRDLALDALTKEKEWSGRDDWYYSLLGDETLADLKVNGQTYTGLTTPLYYAPDDKYVEKMLEFVRSDNPTIRAAAIRNLILKINTKNPEIIKALIPWLEDPKWAVDQGDSRSAIVRNLSVYQIPESVPGLIKMLDEKQTRVTPIYGANMAPAANAVRVPPVNVAPVPPGNFVFGPPVAFYPYRNPAIYALATQKDGRAVPALRRVISEVFGYERSSVVKAILESGGFSVAEQMDALETAAKGVRDEMNAPAAANVAYPSDYNLPYANSIRPPSNGPVTAAEMKYLLGQQLTQASEITDELARAIVDRIENLDGKDPKLATAYRSMVLRWQNAVINILLLRDVKRDAADANTIVRLLSQRKELREKQSSDVFDLRTGKPAAIGIAACLLEDTSDYVTILENADAETKTAMLACARLIRAPLPVAKVGDNLKAPPEILRIAAERYLESEDSPEARSIVLSHHPNEAKILGATTAFFVEGVQSEYSEYLWMLYQSLGDNSLYNGWSGSGNDEELEKAEKSLQTEVKKDGDLVGLYAYDRNYIRIYKDRVIFSWDEDDSRYRERPLTTYEFDDFKSYLTTNRVDELPPFLSCGGAYCSAKELVMLGRNGGRRVYMNKGYYDGSGSNSTPDFFAGLDKYFADLKQTRATLKYSLSREIPGLEILLASDDLHAETVWKEGNDLRVAASDVSVRKKIKAEAENSESDDDLVINERLLEDNYAKKADLLEKRRYEGYAWYKVAEGEAAGVTAQPPGVEFIPPRDALAVQPGDEQWKARAGDFEIRTSEEGLFKLVRGKLTKLHKGNYQDGVVTPNGRWAFVLKSNPERGDDVVRVDLLTNREYPVAIESYGQSYPVAYIPTINKVLIVRNDRYEYEGGYEGYAEDAAPADADPGAMLLVDPATGVTQPIAGEFRPPAQQTFRQLQKASKPNEFWVAIHDPGKNETQVGIYDTTFFGFKPVLRIPKIDFNSMSMWVDEAGEKVYFVYRGHLLALPLGK